MAQETAVEWLYSHLFPKQLDGFSDEEWGKIDKAFEQAKQMEKEHHDKWNKFLDAEKVLGISDVKTIKRIQWYYNTYFNKTFGKS